MRGDNRGPEGNERRVQTLELSWFGRPTEGVEHSVDVGKVVDRVGAGCAAEQLLSVFRRDPRWCHTVQIVPAAHRITTIFGPSRLARVRTARCCVTLTQFGDRCMIAAT